MLKRYDISLFTILMLLLAASLVSCEKESDDPASDKTPIKFGDVETRAAINPVDAMKESGFGVFGYVSGAEGDPLLENERVYWDYENGDYENGIWTYNNTQYWIPDREFHFFAYYPYFDEDETGSITSVAANDNGEIGYQLTFVTPETAAFDLLTAYTTVDTGADNFNTSDNVSLAFTHALVNVNLNIWRDGAKHKNGQMRVKGVALSNVTWSGTVTNTTGGTTSWADLSKKSLLIGNSVNTGNIIGAAETENGRLIKNGIPCVPFGDNGLLLIPVTISGANEVTLTIAYELKRQGALDDVWEEYIIDITLPAMTWKAGTKLTYDVLLSNTVNVTFYYIGTTIDSWGTPQVGGTIIIK